MSCSKDQVVLHVECAGVAIDTTICLYGGLHDYSGNYPRCTVALDNKKNVIVVIFPWKLLYVTRGAYGFYLYILTSTTPN